MGRRQARARIARADGCGWRDVSCAHVCAAAVAAAQVGATVGSSPIRRNGGGGGGRRGDNEGSGDPLILLAITSPQTGPGVAPALRAQAPGV